jgi:hypothetical protein
MVACAKVACAKVAMAGLGRPVGNPLGQLVNRRKLGGLPGCTEVQGYRFSRAVPARVIPALLARLEARSETLI